MVKKLQKWKQWKVSECISVVLHIADEMHPLLLQLRQEHQPYTSGLWLQKVINVYNQCKLRSICIILLACLSVYTGKKLSTKSAHYTIAVQL